MIQRAQLEARVRQTKLPACADERDECECNNLHSCLNVFGKLMIVEIYCNSIEEMILMVQNIRKTTPDLRNYRTGSPI